MAVPAITDSQIEFAARAVSVAKSETDKFQKFYKESRALIIAASDYPGGATSVWPPLPSISGEAEKLREALVEQGFKVEVFNNPTVNTLYPKLKKFLNSFSEHKSRGLVYYLGHGWSDLKTLQGYIVPIDAPDPITQREEFDEAATSMSEINALVKDTPILHTLFVFDSCFSGAYFFARNEESEPSRLSIEDAMKPTREFITAGNETQKVPAVSDFTPAFIAGIRGAAARNRSSHILGASELGWWLKQEVSKLGKETPRFGAILDFNLNQGDFLFLSPAQ